MVPHRHPNADRFPSSLRSSNLPSSAAVARRSARRRRRSPLLAVALALALAAALVLSFLLIPRREIEKELDDDAQGLDSAKALNFGRGGAAGRDSRYWDRDDRRRDQEYRDEDEDENKRTKDNVIAREAKDSVNGARRGSRLYDEGGRAELDSYKEEYEASLKNGERVTEDGDVTDIDDYDDGIDAEDEHDEEHGDSHGLAVGPKDTDERDAGKDLPQKSKSKSHPHPRRFGTGRNTSDRKSALKKKSKRTSCELKFLNSTTELVEPPANMKPSRFALQYTDVENMPSGLESWDPRFAGHQSLEEREESYYAHDQKINCGFVKGPTGTPSTGFDMKDDDVKFMGSCHIAVASCIFGNSDHLRIPFNKMITQRSRKNVCFVMFLDEPTLQTLLSEGQMMNSAGFIGLWKVVVVNNLPYTDMRRVGKIPKFLSHRLFPSARYSIWLDSKLRLQSDPLLILEYFLWRHGYEYAISNHYDRHCVWEEVLQNKKLNKFNHTIIDQQFAFYQADGLRRFDPTNPTTLLPSYVPEGSFIVREHTPMSNLFSCLWFNEVDRFTPRDQLSFAYTYLKLRRLNPGKPFYLNMFKDCERRSIAKLFHHRGEDNRIQTKVR